MPSRWRLAAVAEKVGRRPEQAAPVSARVCSFPCLPPPTPRAEAMAPIHPPLGGGPARSRAFSPTLAIALISLQTSSCRPTKGSLLSSPSGKSRGITAPLLTCGNPLLPQISPRRHNWKKICLIRPLACQRALVHRPTSEGAQPNDPARQAGVAAHCLTGGDSRPASISRFAHLYPGRARRVRVLGDLGGGPPGGTPF